MKTKRSQTNSQRFRNSPKSLPPTQMNLCSKKEKKMLLVKEVYEGYLRPQQNCWFRESGEDNLETHNHTHKGESVCTGPPANRVLASHSYHLSSHFLYVVLPITHTNPYSTSLWNPVLFYILINFFGSCPPKPPCLPEAITPCSEHMLPASHRNGFLTVQDRAPCYMQVTNEQTLIWPTPVSQKKILARNGWREVLTFSMLTEPSSPLEHSGSLGSLFSLFTGLSLKPPVPFIFLCLFTTSFSNPSFTPSRKNDSNSSLSNNPQSKRVLWKGVHKHVNFGTCLVSSHIIRRTKAIMKNCPDPEQFPSMGGWEERDREPKASLIPSSLPTPHP